MSQGPTPSLQNARRLLLQGLNMLQQLPVGRSLSLLPDRCLCMQGVSAQQLPVVRVYMATPLGTFCADVTKALAEDRLQVCVIERLKDMCAQTHAKALLRLRPLAEVSPAHQHEEQPVEAGAHPAASSVHATLTVMLASSVLIAAAASV